ncbi:hypothetical protein SLS62_005446 [Diatrype stigma]|uniref:Uncharacterized protein n=1 Tax=Diatrype stigma TaxID=117547 RepID=A0AAN9USU2_9PEZI
MGSTPPLAALTTIFTPPCQTSWLISTSKIPSQFPPFPTQGPASCDPPEWPENIADKGFQYYSPAICPSGFEVGTDCEVQDTRIAEEKFPPIAFGETAFYCVPSGYTCTTDTSDFRGGVWGYTVTGQTTGKSVDCTVGPAVQIRWKEEDLEALETHPLTPGLVLGGGETTIQATTTQVSTDRTPTTLNNATPEVPASPGITEATDTTEPTEPTEQTEPPTRFSTVVTTLFLSGGLISVSTVTAGISEISSGVTTTPTTTEGSPVGMPTPPSSQMNNAGGKVMGNPIALATVFLSSLFVGVGLVAVAYVLLRRHRSKAASQGQGWDSSPGDSVRGQRGGERWQDAAELEGSSPAWPPAFQLWRTRAELGTDGPIPELGARSAVGTRDNPAELECREAVASSSRRRWSWLSHVSDKLSVRSKKSSPRATPSSRGRGAAAAIMPPRRTLSGASDASTTSTIGSVSSEKALLSQQDSPR